MRSLVRYESALCLVFTSIAAEWDENVPKNDQGPALNGFDGAMPATSGTSHRMRDLVESGAPWFR